MDLGNTDSFLKLPKDAENGARGKGDFRPLIKPRE
jgi:hypothetical protein